MKIRKYWIIGVALFLLCACGSVEQELLEPIGLFGEKPSLSLSTSGVTVSKKNIDLFLDQVDLMIENGIQLTEKPEGYTPPEKPRILKAVENPTKGIVRTCQVVERTITCIETKGLSSIHTINYFEFRDTEGGTAKGAATVEFNFENYPYKDEAGSTIYVTGLMKCNLDFYLMMSTTFTDLFVDGNCNTENDVDHVLEFKMDKNTSRVGIDIVLKKDDSLERRGVIAVDGSSYEL